MSVNTRDNDLRELFKACGTVVRTYISKDHLTGLCKGFAFVTFSDRQEGQRAISKLSGHGYDSLLLTVEWAA